MYVAIDIGGTSTRVALTETLDEVNFIKKDSWYNTHDLVKDKERVFVEIKKFNVEIKGIGIGIPGDISKNGKTVVSTSWNQEWENQSIVEMASNECNCPAYLENDALVSALGIAYYGEGKGKEFAYVTWGTGIGGAVVALERGKAVVSKLDWSKHFESWEAKCGGRKLEERFNKTADKLSSKEWNLVFADFCEELLDFQSKVSGDLIIFGGGISLKQCYRLDNLNKLPEVRDIRISTLREDTGLFGGIGLIRSNLRI